MTRNFFGKDFRWLEKSHCKATEMCTHTINDVKNKLGYKYDQIVDQREKHIG